MSDPNAGKTSAFQYIMSGIANLPYALSATAEAMKKRFEEFAQVHQDLQKPTRNENCVLTADDVKRLADGICRQLENLTAEGELQRKRLAEPGQHFAPTLQMAIYGLSGIRELLDTTLHHYDNLEACVRQEDARRLGLEPPSNLKDPHNIRHFHPNTKVQLEAADPPSKSGIWPWRRSESPNEVLAKRLAQVYGEFVDAARQLSEAFRAAKAEEIEQLNPPMDQVRGLANWLHAQEQAFYGDASKVA